MSSFIVTSSGPVVFSEAASSDQSKLKTTDSTEHYITTKQRERTHQRQRLHQREGLHQRIRSILVWVSFFLLFCIMLFISCLMRFHICS